MSTSIIQSTLFDALELAAPEARPDPLRGADEAVVRRVVVDAKALSRLAALTAVMAAEAGVDHREQTEAALYVRGRDLLIRLALDGRSTTEAGATRTMEVDMVLPLLADLDVPATRAVIAGGTVRIDRLLRGLRNRNGNSGGGVLDGSVELEWTAVRDPRGGVVPDRISIAPLDASGARKPRTISILAPADVRDAQRSIDPVAQSIGLVDASGLVDLADAADPEIGILVDPRPDTAVIGAATTRGTYAMALEGASAGPQAAPFVLSPRLGQSAGLIQVAWDKVSREGAASRARATNLSVRAAALAAGVSVMGAEGRIVLASLVGAGGVERAARAATKQGGSWQTALAFGSALAVEYPGGGLMLEAVAALRATLRGAGVDDIPALEAEALAEGAETPVAALLAVLHRTVGPARAEELAAVHLGRTILGDLGESRPELDELALTAIQELGYEALGCVKAVHGAVADRDPVLWWRAYGEALERLGVDPDVRAALMARSGAGGDAVPSSRVLSMPGQIREIWGREAGRAVSGRIEVLEDGSVRATVGRPHPREGCISVSDLAVRPDPVQYPVSSRELRDALRSQRAVQWTAMVRSDDLEAVAARVDGLEAHGVRTAGPHPLFVARYVAPEAWESGARMPSPGLVQMSGGGSERTDYLSDGDHEERARRSGVLRVVGVEVVGDPVIFDIALDGPMQLETEGTGTRPAAFALDARQLARMVRFATERHASIAVTVSGGAVALSHGTELRSLVLPRIGAEPLHPEIERLVDVLGARGDGTVEVPIDRIRAASAEARERRLAAARALIPEVPSEEAQGPIEWAPPELQGSDADRALALSRVRLVADPGRMAEKVRVGIEDISDPRLARQAVDGLLRAVRGRAERFRPRKLGPALPGLMPSTGEDRAESSTPAEAWDRVAEELLALRAELMVRVAEEDTAPRPLHGHQDGDAMVVSEVSADVGEPTRAARSGGARNSVMQGRRR